MYLKVLCLAGQGCCRASFAYSRLCLPRRRVSVFISFVDRTNNIADRQEATRDDDFGFGGDYDDDDDEEWEAEVDWSAEDADESTDIKDESATYLEFLSQQASKLGGIGGEEEDDDEADRFLLFVPC